MNRFAWALPPLLALTGCISFGPKTPKTLLTLTTSAAVPVGATRAATATNTILVLTPTAPVSIATVRIPVYDGATELSYVVSTAWNEPPAHALQRLLSETIPVRTGRIVLDPRQVIGDPAMRLSGQLQRFGVDPQAMQAVAVFDAQVARPGGTVEVRRFEARAPLGAVEGQASGVALNAAANDLAAQIADWVK